MPWSMSTLFDEIEASKGEAEWMAWAQKMLAARDELGDFVAVRCGRHRPGRFVGYLKGSFNLSFRYSFLDGDPELIIRFPKPGHISTALRDEKITNEVRVMDYLTENTTIPVPRMWDWGLTEHSPHQLGPYIVMEFVEGMLLSEMLKDPYRSDEDVLNPNVDNAILDKIYYQIADYLLQLSNLHFTRIGAISRVSGSYSATQRPLTYNMNELVTVAGYPHNNLMTGPFSTAHEYLIALGEEHMTHLWHQRNLATTPDITRWRYTARSQMPRLVAEHCHLESDKGPFLPFCEDLRPSNMLFNPQTMEITAVVDFEFTNAMPAQFSHDPPWWLLLTGPEWWLDRPAGIEEFRKLFEPRMEQFLMQLKLVEDEARESNKKVAVKKELCVVIKKEDGDDGDDGDDDDDINAAILEQNGPRLSERMRESWHNGQFWFDYAVRRSFDVDAVYWEALFLGDEDELDDMLDDQDRKEMEALVRRKMRQMKAYREDCAAHPEIGGNVA